MKIEFEIIAPDGTLHHTGGFHQYAADERRAFAERIASCQANGYEVRTWQAGARPQHPTSYRQGFRAGLNAVAMAVHDRDRPASWKDTAGWYWLNRARFHWRRIALVIGWLIVGAAAAYAVPTRIHEIITAHQSE